MKQLITLLLVLVFSNISNAQFDKNNAIYTTSELNLGNYIGFDINLNYVYQENYSFKIGYTGNIRKPKSQPDNYSAGFSGLLSIGSANPYDLFENYQIGIGKIYKLNKRGTIRANLSLGIGYTITKTPENWELINNAFLTENYTWNYKKENAIGLIINPKIEFPFTRFYGLTVSPMLQINKNSTYFGIGVGHMIGLLKQRKK